MKLSVASLMVGGVVLLPALASPAFAVPTCPVGSTTVSPGVCEVAFTTTGGPQLYSPPAGITKLEALLVGAGGTSSSMYGGGGGAVTVVNLATSGAVTVRVGVGATGPYDANVNDTLVTQGSNTPTAQGGRSADYPNTYRGAASGNGYESASNANGGSGAGGSATDQNGGSGAVVSTVANAAGSMLFTDVTDCYGGGGAGTYPGYGTATCGGGYMINFVAPTNNAGTWIGGSADIYLPTANSGGGGGQMITFHTPTASTNAYGTWSPQPGAAGKVVLRFTFNELTPDENGTDLADTGSSALHTGILSAAALGLAGVGALIATRRKRLRKA